jgi:hypothetical protein
VVPSRESNSGLPYSKPTRYQLIHAAPLLIHAAPFLRICVAHNSVLQTLGKICSPYVYENSADGKQFAKFSLRFPISHTFLFIYFEFGSQNFS